MRTDNDSWNINTSVGATALFVSAARALETQRPDALIKDEFAGKFLEASDHPLKKIQDVAMWPALQISMTGPMALRTFAIDEAIITKPTDQLVILASGLDSRPYRLDLPPSTKVFEIDMPQVLEFKQSVYDNLGAKPRAEHTALAVDLRKDWISELQQAGFDNSQTTTWLTEGLIPYLPPATQLTLRDTIVENSVPGSQWICDYCAVEHLKKSQSLTKMEKFPPGMDLNIESLFYDLDSQPSKADLLGNLTYTEETLAQLAQRVNYQSIQLDLSPEQKKEVVRFLSTDDNDSSEDQEFDWKKLTYMPMENYEIIRVNF